MKEYVTKWKTDYNFKTLINSAGSFFITIAFTIYNGFLGLRYQSVWHGGICVYYSLLVVIRGSILLTEKHSLKLKEDKSAKSRKRTFLLTAAVLVFMNLALSVPITLMVYQKRPVNIGMIPSITMATYTTYKIILASANIKRMKRSGSIFVRELRTINFIDALVSVLTLQNTLILVNGRGDDSDMFILSAISSAAILLAIIVISIKFILAEIKRKSFNDFPR